MTLEVLSPITNSKNVKIVKKMSTNDIIKKYHEGLNCDINRFFREIDEVSIYKCEDSGYSFYYPFKVSGDSKFYEFLENFNWYYSPWKWEHEQAFSSIKTGSNVLEIGCAKGDFLNKLRSEKECVVEGIELNKSAKIECENKNLKISDLLIEEYSDQNREKFDVVCSFQVLEHISNVQSFLESSIKCLKRGGNLIISVPNNDSFLKLDDNYLNMPPHHMGLWTEESLKSLQKFFPIKYVSTSFEKMDKYHYGYYLKVMDKYLSKYGINGRISSLLKKIILKISSKRFTGFTIQVIFKKIG